MMREKRIWAAVKQRYGLREFFFFFFSRQEIYTCSYTFIAKRKELREGEVRDLEKTVKKARPWMGRDRAQVEIPHSLSLERY